MSTHADTADEDAEDRDLAELCRRIKANDEVSEEVKLIADTILEDIREGRIDATRQ